MRLPFLIIFFVPVGFHAVHVEQYFFIMFWLSFIIDCFSTAGIIMQLQQKHNGF